MRARRSFLKKMLLPIALLPLVRTAMAVEATTWPDWEAFKRLYVSEDGRVIDRSTPEQITTSEGQSYGLFFALIANDRAAFARILRWTQANLADGDLSRKLPGWQWGRAPDQSWRVLDTNSASDSDVWIAYALGEAGRLWCDTTYTQLARALSARILRDEVAFIPKLGATLLPGPKGFVERNTWRLNASYLPIQLLRGLGRLTGEKLWSDLVRSSERVIAASSPRGFAADWIQYRAGEGFVVDRETRGIGSYNAIRVYLWAGTLSPTDPLHSKLAKLLQPMVANAASRASVVEIVDTNTLAMKGEGSPGFSASLLPMLANAKQTAAVDRHRLRADTASLVDGHAYYSDVLTLFGLGWMEGRYRYDRSGQLALAWNAACRSAR